LQLRDILGGNAFDVLIVAASDVFYGKGSVFHAISRESRLLVTLSILMIGILVIGMLHRERYGIGNIGFESALLLLLYSFGFLFITMTG